MRNAEYGCGMAIGSGLDLLLGSGVRVRVISRAWVRVRFRVVFAAILHSFSQFDTFRISQMRNGYGVRLGIRVSG